MRTLVLSGAVLLAATVGATAQTADPVGEWLVKEGTTRIKVVNCPTGPNQAPAIWGVIWAESKPGIDSYNPDPAMRNRPTLGIPILINMKQTEANLWNGKIYDATSGRIWDAKISVSRSDMLEVRGCFGFICSGEDWKRVTGTTIPPVHQPPAGAQAKGGAMAPPGGAMAPPQQTKGAAAPKGAMAKAGAAPPVDPICGNVASLAPRS
jgi:uncharacterized protein (DUF2147 family)